MVKERKTELVALMPSVKKELEGYKIVARESATDCLERIFKEYRKLKGITKSDQPGQDKADTDDPNSELVEGENAIGNPFVKPGLEKDNVTNIAPAPVTNVAE